jgi:membrane protein DedA with SNARE-associated domain
MLLVAAGMPLIQVALLFFATFVHEDAAILAAGFLVIDHDLTLPLVLAVLLIGVVCGDLAVYGMGRLAHRVRFLNAMVHKLVDPGRRSWLERNLMSTVVLCRVAPGLLFPTFLAFGFFSLSFARFAASVVASATIYVPLMLGLVLVVGDQAVSQFGLWGWGAALALVVAITMVRRRFGPAPIAPGDDVLLTLHAGMPALRRSQVRVGKAEALPTAPYYLPIVLQWIWLGLKHRGMSLPTVANPLIEAGGLWGESKAACLGMAGSVAQPWLASSGVLTRGPGADIARDLANALGIMDRAGISFPAVVKPDIGWRGFGVRKVSDAAELGRYIAGFPHGEQLLVQEYLPWAGEAAIFWLRRPGQAKGEIFSLTFRYFPFVVGDGKASLKELILACPRMRWKSEALFEANGERLDWVPGAGDPIRLALVGSNRVAGLYIDGRRHATPALLARVEQICADLPEFHFGRMDVRFRSIEELEAGLAFKIVEINGAGAEAVHIWDPDMPVLEGYRTLFEQQRLLFEIAAANRDRGFQPLGLRALFACCRRQQRLQRLYPQSA